MLDLLLEFLNWANCNIEGSEFVASIPGITGSIEGKISKPLKKLLKKLVSEEAQEELAVADAKIGSMIKVNSN